MINLGEKLFSAEPRALDVNPPRRETAAEAEARVKQTQKLFRRVFDNADGKKLLKMLYTHSHPLAPRFGAGRSAEEAAFLDGERALIGLLWLNGTSEPTMNPMK